MAGEVEETNLPGVGVRHDFRTTGGDRVGVLILRSGRRELFIYDEADPDTCRAVAHLDLDDSRTLGELLGASRLSEAMASVQQQVEGLAIDWLPVEPGSAYAGRSLRDAGLREATGASIVAVVRGNDATPVPGPDFVLEGGDVAVAIGTPEGLGRLFTLLQKG